MASIDAGAPLPGAGQDRVVRPRSFVARNGRLLFAWALLIAILLAYITVVPQFRPGNPLRETFVQVLRKAAAEMQTRLRRLSRK